MQYVLIYNVYMKIKKILLALPLTILFSGCFTEVVAPPQYGYEYGHTASKQYYQNNYQSGQRNREKLGTFGGAIGGAVIGSQFGNDGMSKAFGATVGGLLGGVFGNQVGKRLDYNSQKRMQEATQFAIARGDIGRDYSWSGDNAYGSITPMRDFRDQRGDYCREFSHSVNIGGKIERAYGTACRMPDGAWRIIQ